ncbi:hypothetical protein HPP92_025768 [Vanilla planifolia]|uniref:Uncharacterized protein n=1 Tax=Vanilla planifolia TaxID=51239 RepID=A0A835PJU9_VANPL|nr:hypothetical protein HPP92_025768 [Vanilla planifolia]
MEAHVDQRFVQRLLSMREFKLDVALESALKDAPASHMHAFVNMYKGQVMEDLANSTLIWIK